MYDQPMTAEEIQALVDSHTHFTFAERVKHKAWLEKQEQKDAEYVAGGGTYAHPPGKCGCPKCSKNEVK